MKTKIPTIKSLTFTCPKCGGHLIEEVTVNVSLYNRILTMNTRGTFEYDLIDQSNGELDHYRCGACDYVVVDKQGNNITACLDLVKWLKRQQRKKKK